MDLQFSLAKRTAFNLSAAEQTYVFDTCQPHTSEGAAQFAASASNHTIKIFQRDNLVLSSQLSGHKEKITGIMYAHSNPNLLLSSSEDGVVGIWDVRAGQMNHKFKVPKGTVPISCAINPDDTLVAVGTELAGEDARVLLFDVRSKPMLFALEDAHSDDVTQTVFNPLKPGMLATGSTDGLVNIFDLTQATSLEEPDDSLVLTLNSDSSISKIGFFGPNAEFIFGLTHTEAFCLWHAYERGEDESEEITIIPDLREKIAEQGLKVDYFVDSVYHEPTQRLFMVGGTADGTAHLMHVNMDGVVPAATFHGAHSEVIRTFNWDWKHTNSIVIGGEDACLSLWTPSNKLDAVAAASAVRPAPEKDNEHARAKPY
eukprot:m.173989 g.173989  ORF g.173989 m.173989 type:complete len:371 (-) comp15398_c0_seq12:1770-2882(-)